MQKHAIFNNTHFRGLRPSDRELLLRNAAIKHYDSNNNKQILDGNGCTVGVVVLNVSLKEYSAGVRNIVAQVTKEFGFQLNELKCNNINLTIPAKNALKHTSSDLNNFCDKYFTACFDELLAEKKQKQIEQKEAEMAANRLRFEAEQKQLLEKQKIKEQIKAEQDKRDNIKAILSEAALEDWE